MTAPERGSGRSYGAYLQDKVRDKHPAGVALDALAKLGLRIVPFSIFAESHDTNSGAAGDPAFGSVEIGPLGEDDMSEMAEIPFRWIGRETLVGRLRDGSLCLGARLEGRLVGFTWADLERFRFPGYVFELEPNEAYRYDSYVVPELRRRGLLSHVSKRMVDELVRRGRTTSYRAVNRFNRSSLGLMRKLDNTMVGSGLWVEGWGLRFRTQPTPEELEALRRRAHELRRCPPGPQV